MANRRMFSLDVVDTDKFLDMPATSQNLYFHLGMRADDDGFVSSPKKITKLVNCGDDDLKVLASRGFIIEMGDGIVVIKHWKQNNYIQNDRYKPTIYQKQFDLLVVNDGVYELDTGCIQHVSELEAQYRIDKDRIEKDRKKRSLRSPEVDRTIEAWNALGLRPIKKLSPSSRRYQNLVERIEENGIDDVLQAIQKIWDSSYLQGKTEGGRMIELEWFVDPDNFSKVLEGYYDDSERRQQDNQKIEYSEPEPELDRFACMDQGLRREMERVGVIVGQTLNFAGCSVDDAGKYIDWLNGIEIQEDEETPETLKAEGWIDPSSMSDEEIKKYMREHSNDYE